MIRKYSERKYSLCLWCSHTWLWVSLRSWFISVNDACFQQCVKPVLNLLCIMLLWKLQSPTVCVSVALSIKWPGFFLHLWMPFFLWPHSWLDMMPKNHLPCYHLSRRCLRFIIAHLSMVFSGVHNKVHCPFCVLLKLAYSGTPILQTTLSILDIPVAFVYEMKNVSLQLWAYPAVSAKSPYQFHQKYCPMMQVIKCPASDIFNFCNRQRQTLLIHAIY